MTFEEHFASPPAEQRQLCRRQHTSLPPQAARAAHKHAADLPRTAIHMTGAMRSSRHSQKVSCKKGELQNRATKRRCSRLEVLGVHHPLDLRKLARLLGFAHPALLPLLSTCSVLVRLLSRALQQGRRVGRKQVGCCGGRRRRRRQHGGGTVWQRVHNIFDVMPSGHRGLAGGRVHRACCPLPLRTGQALQNVPQRSTHFADGQVSLCTTAQGRDSCGRCTHGGWRAASRSALNGCL